MNKTHQNSRAQRAASFLFRFW